MSGAYERCDLEKRTQEVADSMTVQQMKDELKMTKPPVGRFCKAQWARLLASHRFRQGGKKIGLSFFTRLI